MIVDEVIDPELPLLYVPLTVNVVTDRLYVADDVKVEPELTVRVDKIGVFAFSVTVYPLSITTISPVDGTVAPDAPPDVADQVDVEFQFPVATEKRLAAEA